MALRKKIASIENLPDDVLEALQEKYPDGWEGQTTKISNAKGEYFRAITLDYGDTTYLVKVPIEIDSVNYWEKDDDRDDDLDIIEGISDKSIAKELEEEQIDDDDDNDDDEEEDDDDDDDDEEEDV